MLLRQFSHVQMGTKSRFKTLLPSWYAIVFCVFQSKNKSLFCYSLNILPTGKHRGAKIRFQNSGISDSVSELVEKSEFGRESFPVLCCVVIFILAENFRNCRDHETVYLVMDSFWHPLKLRLRCFSFLSIEPNYTVCVSTD